MTCIVGLVDKSGRGYIAGDSVGSNGHTKGLYRNAKVFRLGDKLIGYTSSYRMGQLLQYSLTLPQRGKDEELDQYLHRSLVPTVRHLLKDNGYMEVDRNREQAGQFLLIAEGRLFEIQEDLSLMERVEGFDAIGSGAHHAIATLHCLTNHSRLSPQRIVEEAIRTAERYVTTVGGEVTVLSTDQEG